MKSLIQIVGDKTWRRIQNNFNEEIDEMPSPRLIKSHAPTNLLLGMTGDKLDTMLSLGIKNFVVTRNPFHSCVSRYYHAFDPFQIGWPFPAWAALWINENSSYGSWFDWVRGWSEQAKKNVDQILWIQYEDMLSNPENEIKKIQSFINISNPDDNFLDNVREGCIFDSTEKTVNGKRKLRRFSGTSSTRNYWRLKNHFTEHMKTVFLRKYEMELDGSGLAYDFGKD